MKQFDSQRLMELHRTGEDVNGRISSLLVTERTENLFSCFMFEAGKDNHYAIPNYHLDTRLGGVTKLKDIEIMRDPFCMIKGRIRYLVNLPRYLGHHDEFDGESVVIPIQPRMVGGDELCIVIKNNYQHRTFEKIEVINPRELGDDSFPDYAPYVIDTDVGIVQVLDLRKLLVRGGSR